MSDASSDAAADSHEERAMEERDLKTTFASRKMKPARKVSGRSSGAGSGAGALHVKTGHSLPQCPVKPQMRHWLTLSMALDPRRDAAMRCRPSASCGRREYRQIKPSNKNFSRMKNFFTSPATVVSLLGL